MMESRKPGPLAADKIVNIVREDDGGSIAEQLERAGVIDNATWFSLLTLLDGNRNVLKRGEYEFKAGVSMNEIESLLAAHRVVQHKLTIPEGLTSEQIVQRLRDDDVLVGDIKETPREGSLMPDTYYFERGFSRQSLLARMAKAQTRIVDEIWKSARAGSPHQIVGRDGHPRLDRREGNGQGRRAPASGRRLRQSIAEAHAARVRSDDRLRSRLRQGHARALHLEGGSQPGHALQHLLHRGSPAGADFQPRQGGARGGRQAGPQQGPLLRG